jgi:hypothetical protein
MRSGPPGYFLRTRADGDNEITWMIAPPRGRQAPNVWQTASGVVYERNNPASGNTPSTSQFVFPFSPTWVCLGWNRWANQVCCVVLLKPGGYWEGQQATLWLCGGRNEFLRFYIACVKFEVYHGSESSNRGLLVRVTTNTCRKLPTCLRTLMPLSSQQKLCPEEGGSMFFRNVRNHLQGFTVS